MKGTGPWRSRNGCRALLRSFGATKGSALRSLGGGGHLRHGRVCPLDLPGSSGASAPLPQVADARAGRYRPRHLASVESGRPSAYPQRTRWSLEVVLQKPSPLQRRAEVTAFAGAMAMRPRWCSRLTRSTRCWHCSRRQTGRATPFRSRAAVRLQTASRRGCPWHTARLYGRI